MFLPHTLPLSEVHWHWRLDRWTRGDIRRLSQHPRTWIRNPCIFPAGSWVPPPTLFSHMQRDSGVLTGAGWQTHGLCSIWSLVMESNGMWCMENEGRWDCGMLLTPSSVPLLTPWVLDKNKPELPKEILAYGGDWFTKYLWYFQDYMFPGPTKRPPLGIATWYISEHTFAKTKWHIQRWKDTMET